MSRRCWSGGKPLRLPAKSTQSEPGRDRLTSPAGDIRISATAVRPAAARSAGTALDQGYGERAGATAAVEQANPGLMLERRKSADRGRRSAAQAGATWGCCRTQLLTTKVTTISGDGWPSVAVCTEQEPNCASRWMPL